MKTSCKANRKQCCIMIKKKNNQEKLKLDHYKMPLPKDDLPNKAPTEDWSKSEMVKLFNRQILLM